uniref:protein phosphatase 1 regulatory subunit 3C-like n=1 Tax=Styela clava TaxID=7725 RepID=UPI00193A6990|nr:protein phosphatase 1 regulatory subunit 3C-like [Styela clava]
MTVSSKADTTLERSSNRYDYYNPHGMPGDLSFIYSSSPPLHSACSEQYMNVVPDLIRRSCRNQFTRYMENAKVNGYRHLDVFDGKVGNPLRTPSPVNGISPESDSVYLDSVIKSCLRMNTAVSKSKKVTFADTHGMSLTMIKYMKEATTEPPVWEDLGFVMRSLRLSSAACAQEPSIAPEKQTLVADFKQPAADYIKFKQNLEINNVSLENVILKELTSISGTIKVKNISFEKKVFVRITFDKWLSFSDHEATYIKNFCDDEIYDTFQFNIAVPKSFDPVMQNVQFCICFASEKGEFWDNNNGGNYVISTNVSVVSNCVKPSTDKVHALPSTYCELPSPQFNTWLDWENKGRFY